MHCGGKQQLEVPTVVPTQQFEIDVVLFGFSFGRLGQTNKFKPGAAAAVGRLRVDAFAFGEIVVHAW